MKEIRLLVIAFVLLPVNAYITKQYTEVQTKCRRLSQSDVACHNVPQMVINRQTQYLGKMQTTLYNQRLTESLKVGTTSALYMVYFNFVVRFKIKLYMNYIVDTESDT